MGAISRGPDGPAWSQTLACVDALCAGTGRSHDRPFGNCRRSASGRRGAVADDARSREVRLRHSSWEAELQYPDTDPAGRAVIAGFVETLEKLGWTIGRNLSIDYRWGVLDFERART